MREIKFRGKCMCSDEWVYGDLIHKRHDRDALMIQDENGLGNDVVPESVGQFTGLYDESGNGIYEGDVIERFQPNPHYRNGVYYDGNAIYGVVRYIESGFYIVTKDDDAFKMSSNYDMWVQGVIHDNPNLLTNGND